MPHVTPLQDSDPRSIGRYQMLCPLASFPQVFLAESASAIERRPHGQYSIL